MAKPWTSFAGVLPRAQQFTPHLHTLKKTMQGANWCYTLNNYTDDHETKLRGILGVKYHVCGREVGEAGTPHLQGYLELTTRMRMGAVKELIGIPEIHLELRKARAYQAADYCKKDGDFYEVGTEPPRPKKVDNKIRWREVLDKCIAGDWVWMVEHEPYLWLMNEKRMRSHYKCSKSIDVLSNEWIYGPTGSGKSRDARTRYPDAYIKDASNHWWDGYNGEDVVIIEDFDKYHVKQGYYLKIWADHYAFPAQIKGGQMMCRPSKIIVTSNYSPREIWEDNSTVGPIERRFALIFREVPIQFNIPPSSPHFVTVGTVTPDAPRRPALFDPVWNDLYWRSAVEEEEVKTDGEEMEIYEL
nr:MAG: replication associated protein [Cressdnaviricota sp.]